ncbi:MAG: hypothetical protein AAGA77_13270 [Bacteroidota bacterium]
MKLKRGLSIYSNLPAIEDQVAINGGSVSGKKNISGFKYIKGAHIPKLDWRPLSQAEKDKLIATDSNIPYSKSLYIGDVPPKLKKVLQDMELDQCEKLEEINIKLTSGWDAVRAATDELDVVLSEISTKKDFYFHKITTAVPNKETVTYFNKRKQPRYIGLHIDKSRNFRIHTANKSQNRISINLSKETRYLVFLNLTLIQVYNMIKKKVDTTQVHIHPNNIVEYFFKYYPDYPVTRVAQKPYQYYVAPTDNFLHDGCTLGNKNIDVTLVYIGSFDMPVVI